MPSRSGMAAMTSRRTRLAMAMRVSPPMVWAIEPEASRMSSTLTSRAGPSWAAAGRPAPGSARSSDASRMASQAGDLDIGRLLRGRLDRHETVGRRRDIDAERSLAELGQGAVRAQLGDGGVHGGEQCLVAGDARVEDRKST